MVLEYWEGHFDLDTLLFRFALWNYVSCGALCMLLVSIINDINMDELRCSVIVNALKPSRHPRYSVPIRGSSPGTVPLFGWKGRV